RELSELAVKLRKKNELVQIFDELLQHGGDESGTYLAHVDYADGLAKFNDNGADARLSKYDHFQSICRHSFWLF
ncbi:MAG: hypothetical protein HRT38_16090, partial [Alteromonadaceae bacterium]|nr:hypothetical protein [Alteromonadaceae bacterium]